MQFHGAGSTPSTSVWLAEVECDAPKTVFPPLVPATRVGSRPRTPPCGSHRARAAARPRHPCLTTGR